MFRKTEIPSSEGCRGVFTMHILLYNLKLKEKTCHLRNNSTKSRQGKDTHPLIPSQEGKTDNCERLPEMVWYIIFFMAIDLRFNRFMPKQKKKIFLHF